MSGYVTTSGSLRGDMNTISRHRPSFGFEPVDLQKNGHFDKIRFGRQRYAKLHQKGDYQARARVIAKIETEARVQDKKENRSSDLSNVVHREGFKPN